MRVGLNKREISHISHFLPTWSDVAVKFDEIHKSALQGSFHIEQYFTQRSMGSRREKVWDSLDYAEHRPSKSEMLVRFQTTIKHNRPP